MHGEGHLRKCRECGADVRGRNDVLAFLELRGPRNITSSNVDRIFDDGGKRFLIIEEKQPGEKLKAGQHKLLANLARLPLVDVWGVKGTPDSLAVSHYRSDTGTWERIGEGDMRTYERCVHAWFAAETGEAEHALDVLSELPHKPPAGCAPELWDQLDKTLVAIHKQLKRGAA